MNYVDVVLLIIDPDSNIDASKVSCLDYFDNGQDIIIIELFESSGFTDIELIIREKICTDNQVPPEGVPPGTPEWVYPNNITGLGPIPTTPGGGRNCSNDPGAVNPCNPAVAGFENAQDLGFTISDGDSSGNGLVWKISVAVIVVVLLAIIAGVCYVRISRNRVVNKFVGDIEHHKIMLYHYGSNNATGDDNSGIYGDCGQVAADEMISYLDIKTPESVGSPDIIRMQQLNNSYAGVAQQQKQQQYEE